MVLCSPFSGKTLTRFWEIVLQFHYYIPLILAISDLSCVSFYIFVIEFLSIYQTTEEFIQKFEDIYELLMISVIILINIIITYYMYRMLHQYIDQYFINVMPTEKTFIKCN